MIAFDSYTLSGDASYLPVIKKFCTYLGQSWDDLVVTWQVPSNSTSPQNTTDVDPLKRYTWYIGAINKIVEVRRKFPFYTKARS